MKRIFLIVVVLILLSGGAVVVARAVQVAVVDGEEWCKRARRQQQQQEDEVPHSAPVSSVASAARAVAIRPTRCPPAEPPTAPMRFGSI